jgi:hypothetical protein
MRIGRGKPDRGAGALTGGRRARATATRLADGVGFGGGEGGSSAGGASDFSSSDAAANADT